MNRYEASWFCHGEWKHLILEIIAASEAEVEAYITTHYTKPEYRAKPYRSQREPETDSLRIIDLGPITFPYELRYY